MKIIVFCVFLIISVSSAYYLKFLLNVRYPDLTRNLPETDSYSEYLKSIALYKRRLQLLGIYPIVTDAKLRSYKEQQANYDYVESNEKIEQAGTDRGESSDRGDSFEKEISSESVEIRNTGNSYNKQDNVVKESVQKLEDINLNSGLAVAIVQAEVGLLEGNIADLNIDQDELDQSQLVHKDEESLELVNDAVDEKLISTLSEPGRYSPEPSAFLANNDEDHLETTEIEFAPIKHQVDMQMSNAVGANFNISPIESEILAEEHDTNLSTSSSEFLSKDTIANFADMIPLDYISEFLGAEKIASSNTIVKKPLIDVLSKDGSSNGVISPAELLEFIDDPTGLELMPDLQAPANSNPKEIVQSNLNNDYKTASQENQSNYNNDGLDKIVQGQLNTGSDLGYEDGLEKVVQGQLNTGSDLGYEDQNDLLEKLNVDGESEDQLNEVPSNDLNVGDQVHSYSKNSTNSENNNHPLLKITSNANQLDYTQQDQLEENPLTNEKIVGENKEHNYSSNIEDQFAINSMDELVKITEDETEFTDRLDGSETRIQDLYTITESLKKINNNPIIFDEFEPVFDFKDIGQFKIDQQTITENTFDQSSIKNSPEYSIAFESDPNYKINLSADNLVNISDHSGDKSLIENSDEVIFDEEIDHSVINESVKDEFNTSKQIVLDNRNNDKVILSESNDPYTKTNKIHDESAISSPDILKKKSLLVKDLPDHNKTLSYGLRLDKNLQPDYEYGEDNLDDNLEEVENLRSSNGPIKIYIGNESNEEIDQPTIAHVLHNDDLARSSFKTTSVADFILDSNKSRYVSPDLKLVADNSVTDYTITDNQAIEEYDRKLINDHSDDSESATPEDREIVSKDDEDRFEYDIGRHDHDQSDAATNLKSGNFENEAISEDSVGEHTNDVIAYQERPKLINSNKSSEPEDQSTNQSTIIKIDNNLLATNANLEYMIADDLKKNKDSPKIFDEFEPVFDFNEIAQFKISNIEAEDLQLAMNNGHKFDQSSIDDSPQYSIAENSHDDEMDHNRINGSKLSSNDSNIKINPNKKHNGTDIGSPDIFENKNLLIEDIPNRISLDQNLQPDIDTYEDSIEEIEAEKQSSSNTPIKSYIDDESDQFDEEKDSPILRIQDEGDHAKEIKSASSELKLLTDYPESSELEEDHDKRIATNDFYEPSKILRDDEEAIDNTENGFQRNFGNDQIPTFKNEDQRRSDILIEDDFDDYSLMGNIAEGSDEILEPKTKQQADMIRLIPFVIEQYRRGSISKDEEETLANSMGDLFWPLIQEEVNRKPNEEMNQFLATILKSIESEDYEEITQY